MAMHSSNSNMDRISQWVTSQEIPPDLTVRIGDSVFPLHKAVMVAKCGYIRRALAAATKDPYTATVELDLSAIPGGADAFEQAALYCYGGATNLEITARNAAPLLCAAAFLDMHQTEGGLVRRVEEFLAQSGLRTLANAVAVLRSCERVGPAAEELGIVRRAADAVALKICNEAVFPTVREAPPGWWAAELAALSPASFGKVVTALRCRRAGSEVIATAAAAYAEITLAEVLLPGDPTGCNSGGDQKIARLLESVVDVLPSAGDAPLPAAFLCRLLHVAVNNSNVPAKTCRDLELRVAAVLDQATAEDLFGVALDASGERVTHADTVRHVITAFVERHNHHHQQKQSSSLRSRRASLSLTRGGAEDAEENKVTEKVARTVDEAAAEMATEEEMLPVSKFVGVLGAVPREWRANHDYLYRAIDIYLKTHPSLDEIQREKVCGVMDPLKLSYQARLHASQNKRLPLNQVLTALYYDQLNLRSSTTTPAVHHALINNNNNKDLHSSSLARENEALRLELAQMRAYLSTTTMQHSTSISKGSSSSRPPLPAKKKKAANSLLLLGSVVTRTLSRLNPFNFKAGGVWAKDTSSIVAPRDHVVKPKRRRFSIS